MYNKLVLISVSRIQSLILKKRGVGDLYAASWLVKNFMRKMNSFLTENQYLKFSSVFNYSDKKEVEDPANFILGKVETDISDDIKIEKQTRMYLNNVVLEMHQDVKELQIYIAVTDLNENNYKEAYKSLLLKIQAYKMNRLSGMIYWKETNKVPDHNRIKAPSTSTIASNEWCKMFDKAGRFERIRKELYANQSEKKDTYEEIYYKEDLQKYCKTENNKELLNKLKRIKKELPEPSSYYALVRLDIDNLGYILSGEDLNESYNLETFQIDLHQKLNRFASSVREYLKRNGLVNNNEELTVYMGGDDMLFFSPLNKIVLYLTVIKKYFMRVKEWLLDNYSQKISYSTSIILAHRKNPFQQVISESANELDKIKNMFRYKKEGTAISLILRGGNVRRAYLKDNISDYYMPEIIRLFHENGILSKSFLYSLEREFESVGEELEEEVFEVFKNEIKRIYLRKIGNSEKEDNNEFGKMFLDIALLFKEGRYFSKKGYLDYLHILLKWSVEVITIEGGAEDGLCEDISR